VPRTNDEVAALLHELATLTQIDEGSPQAFRVRAYQHGVRAVKGIARDVAEMSTDELLQVKGIGKAIASKVREYVESGHIRKLDELRATYPKGQLELMRIPGLGPKGITLLREVLGVTDLASLKEAIADGRLAGLPGMGEKTAENLARAIDRLALAEEERRVPIAQAMPLAERIVSRLEELPEAGRVAYAGSLRRFRDTIGDIDVLVESDTPGPIMAALAAHPEVAEVIASGEKKTSVVTFDGMQVDCRVVPTEAYGAALVYFTGSKEHNIRLRERALKRGLTLNEYGLAPVPEATDDDHAPARPTQAEHVSGATEQEVYAALDLAWVTPEMREDAGEIQAAEAGTLPDLPTVEDLRGDLHDHTDWSGDGRATMEDMVAAAASRGLVYLAITDHAENLTINGIDRAGMLAQRRELRELNERYPDLALLHGAELNIGIDGSLDYDRDFLLGYDWCVASVHSHFRRPVEEQTARVITAMRHPAVNVIGHLQGRRVGKREGIELDLDAVLDAAVETGTAIEINSNLDRLDATAEVIAEGAKRGVMFVISTDAHSVREFDYHRYGIRQARRGGLPRRLVANTMDRDAFVAWARDQRATS
jgi:DNA polymerase (family 10)